MHEDDESGNAQRRAAKKDALRRPAPRRKLDSLTAPGEVAAPRRARRGAPAVRHRLVRRCARRPPISPAPPAPSSHGQVQSVTPGAAPERGRRVRCSMSRGRQWLPVARGARPCCWLRRGSRSRLAANLLASTPRTGSRSTRRMSPRRIKSARHLPWIPKWRRPLATTHSRHLHTRAELRGAKQSNGLVYHGRARREALRVGVPRVIRSSMSDKNPPAQKAGGFVHTGRRTSHGLIATPNGGFHEHRGCRFMNTHPWR